MKTLNTWAVVKWGAVLLVYGLTLAICLDQIRERDRTITDQKASSKAMPVTRARPKKIVAEAPPAPAPVGSDAAKVAEIDGWAEMTAEVARTIPLIRRAYAAGSTDRYLAEEKGKTIEQLQKASIHCEELEKEWRSQFQSSPRFKAYSDLFVEMQGNIKGLIAQAETLKPYSYEAQESAKTDEIASTGMDGVPKEIFDAIVTKVRAKESGVFVNAQIKNEADGYKKLEAFKVDAAIPSEVRTAIVQAAERKNDGNWTGMSDHVERQAQGWKTFTKWMTSGIPGIAKDRADQLLKDAEKKYPNDWTMQVFEVNSMIDSAPVPVTTKKSP